MAAAFVRALAMILAVASILCPQSQAQVQKGCDDGYHDKGRTMFVLGKGSSEFWRSPCQDDECRAIKDIACAVTGQARILTPNIMAFHTIREGERALIQAGLNIWSLGREHPKRIPLYCKLLARVATTLTGDKDKDERTASNIFQLAILLDRPYHHCLAEVVAALPPQVAAQGDSIWGWECQSKIPVCQKWMDRDYGPKRPIARHSKN